MDSFSINQISLGRVTKEGKSPVGENRFES